MKMDGGMDSLHQCDGNKIIIIEDNKVKFENVLAKRSLIMIITFVFP